MATFTMELREVLESLYGTTMDPDDYAIKREPVIFRGTTYGTLPVLDDYSPIGLAEYPIFDELYRPILNGKIIEEYFHREIGVETIEMFVWRLRAKMNQVMPFFNQLYESTMIEYSALDTMRIQSVGKNHIEGVENTEAETDSTTTNKSGSRAIGSDFPQTMLAGNADYARTGTDTTSDVSIGVDGESKSESTSNTDANSDNLVTGYQGAASDLINKFRNSIINTDTDVLASLEDNFMLVLNNGDEYFGSGSYWRY
jgi:hypothetical protein